MKVSRKQEQGFTLLEVLIAALILFIVSAGVLGLLSFAMLQNNTGGEQGTRATEYAQDKMEQLMAMSFSDTASDTTTYPTNASGGVGLTAGGGINISSPVTGYVDYIDGTGSPTNVATGASYIREWLIVNSTAQIKTITVSVQQLSNAKGTAPASTVLVCQKNSSS
jgi:Tfp pilus assembly protein PilV